MPISLVSIYNDHHFVYVSATSGAIDCIGQIVRFVNKGQGLRVLGLNVAGAWLPNAAEADVKPEAVPLKPEETIDELVITSDKVRQVNLTAEALIELGDAVPSLDVGAEGKLAFVMEEGGQEIVIGKKCTKEHVASGLKPSVLLEQLQKQKPFDVKTLLNKPGMYGIVVGRMWSSQRQGARGEKHSVVCGISGKARVLAPADVKVSAKFDFKVTKKNVLSVSTTSSTRTLLGLYVVAFKVKKSDEKLDTNHRLEAALKYYGEGAAGSVVWDKNEAARSQGKSSAPNAASTAAKPTVAAAAASAAPASSASDSSSAPAAAESSLPGDSDDDSDAEATEGWAGVEEALDISENDWKHYFDKACGSDHAGLAAAT